MQILDQETRIILPSAGPWHTYFADQAVGFFDIETTGLSPRHCSLILGGLLLPNPPGEGSYIARQYLAESLDEEPLVIETLLSDLAQLDTLVTYHGDRFDLPFLSRRMEEWNIPQISLPFSLDLYRAIRDHSDLKRFLPNLKQKTVESFLGLWQDRQDEIDGGDSVRLYYHWLKSRDEEVLRRILLHNHDDILQLSRLLKVIDKVDFHGTMTDLGFPVGRLQIRHVDLEQEKLCFSGLQSSPGRGRKHLNDAPVDYEYHGDGTLSFSYEKASSSFIIRINLHRRDRVLLADLSELALDPSDFEEDPALQGDLLMLQIDEEINYRALNRLIRALVERIEATWITAS